MGTRQAKMIRRQLRKFTKETYANFRKILINQNFWGRIKIAFRVIFKTL